ncbi:GNAT family N-acetyltransferase [Bacteroidales bacterium OttesenSCG-928-A17]|nr:GNAT family N-acetyltransferase [Bacteroidales bacterium OttesenSCG-928-A17]
MSREALSFDNTFQIKKADREEIDKIMPLYSRARQFMQETGNQNQWINGYPSREDILSDINARCLYVCISSKNEIAGAFFFKIGEEPTYHSIYDGKWLNDKPYGVIHRLASSGKYKGIGNICFLWCLKQCQNLRVDTHQDNHIMQHIFRKNGLVYCGIIYLRNGSKRLAFQSIPG